MKIKGRGGSVRQYMEGGANPKKREKHRLYLPTMQKCPVPTRCSQGVLWVLRYMWYIWHRFCIWQRTCKLTFSESDPDIQPLQSHLGQLLMTAVKQHVLSTYGWDCLFITKRRILSWMKGPLPRAQGGDTANQGRKRGATWDWCLLVPSTSSIRCWCKQNFLRGSLKS